MPLSDVNIRIGAEISQFQRGLRKAERELQRSARKFNQIGNNLSVALSLPLAAAGAAAFKFATDFEESFLKLNTLVGISEDSLTGFEKALTELSGPLGKSKTELSDALFVITSAGQRGASALETLEQASKASAIGLGNTEEIARAAVSAVQAYGEANLSSAAAVDKLTAIVREGNLAAEELAPTLGKVLPIAAQLGVSFDEVGANIAAFSRLGVSASESVTALKSLLSSILKPSAEAAKELERIGISAQDLRDSIANNGLAATLQSLIEKYDGNVEGLSKLIPNVEGLANVLGTAGAQGEEYARIVDSIANSNGIVNEGFEKVSQTANFKLKQALVSLQTVGEQLGAVLVPVITDLLNAAVPLVQGFASLDDGTKKLVVSFGLAAAAAGPLFKLIGGSIELYSTARSAVLSFAKAGEVASKSYQAFQAVTAAGANNLTGLQNGLRAAATAWKALDTVAKATVIGAALAVVVALGVAMYDLADGMGEAAKVQATLNDVSLTAEKNIAKERVEAAALTEILKDNTASLDERQTALQRLNQIAPEYFGNLNAEKSGVEDITKAYDSYINNLLRAAKVQAAQAKITELETKRLELLDTLQNGNVLQKAAATFNTSGILPDFLGGDIFRQLGEIDAQQKALADIAFNAQDLNQKLQASANQAVAAPISGGLVPGIAPTGGGGSAPSVPATADLAPAAADAFKYAEALAAANAQGFTFAEGQFRLAQAVPQVAVNLSEGRDELTALGEALAIADNKALVFGDSYNAAAEKLNLVNGAISGLIESGLDPTSEKIQVLTELQAQLNAEMLNAVPAAEQMRAAYEAMTFAGQSVVDITNAVSDAFIQATADGKASAEDLAKAVYNAARKEIAAAIAVGVAKQISAALGTGPAGLILAPIAAAAATALFTSYVPKFADGGIITGPTYGLVGEAGPEVIFPLSDLKKFVGEGGGMQFPNVLAEVSGDKILLVTERSAQRRSRRTG